jgi:adhesin transport system outer membrane protein
MSYRMGKISRKILLLSVAFCGLSACSQFATMPSDVSQQASAQKTPVLKEFLNRFRSVTDVTEQVQEASTLSAIPMFDETIEVSELSEQPQKTTPLAPVSIKQVSETETIPEEGGAKRPVAQAASDPAQISLPALLAKVLSDNPEIGIAEAQLADAEAGVEIERLGQKSTVNLTMSTGLENTYSASATHEGTFRNEVALSLDRVLYDFGTSKSAIKRRIELAQSAELRRLTAVDEITLSVVSAYLEYLRSTRLVSAGARNVASHKRIADLVALNEAGGNANKADVSRAQTRLEQARANKLSAENNREDAITAFKRLTDFHPSAVVRAELPLRITPNAAPAEAVLVANPSLQAANADIEAIERQIDEQRASIKPEVFFRGEANLKDNVGGPNGTSSDLKGLVGFRARLYDGGVRRSQVKQLRARLREAEARYDRRYQELLQLYDQNAQLISTGGEQTRFINQRVATARNAFFLFQDQFEAGERTAFELLDAQRDLFQSETDQINTAIDSQLTLYQNLQLRGQLAQSLLSTQ